MPTRPSRLCAEDMGPLSLRNQGAQASPPHTPPTEPGPPSSYLMAGARGGAGEVWAPASLSLAALHPLPHAKSCPQQGTASRSLPASCPLPSPPPSGSPSCCSPPGPGPLPGPAASPPPAQAGCGAFFGPVHRRAPKPTEGRPISAGTQATDSGYFRPVWVSVLCPKRKRMWTPARQAPAGRPETPKRAARARRRGHLGPSPFRSRSPRLHSWRFQGPVATTSPNLPCSGRAWSVGPSQGHAG